VTAPDTATALLRLYRAVRTPLGCLACDPNHTGALPGEFFCACACHETAGLLRSLRVLVEPIPHRRVTDEPKEGA
jgi:hypothetical protein